jgi:putative transposase
MPRHARVVFPGVPHHVTQRGIRRERVFFRHTDYWAYVQLLLEYSSRRRLEIAAYCLMPNHVHLVAVPPDEKALHLTLKAVHGRFAQRINRAKAQGGHRWQGRFFSSPLDAQYFLNAVRYVELNPVRAGIVAVAENYAWSSAASHCGLRRDPLLESSPLNPLLAGIANWSRWLVEGVADGVVTVLRRHAGQNLPCGSPEFVAELERAAGRELRYRPRGREAETNGDARREASVPFKSERPL